MGHFADLRGWPGSGPVPEVVGSHYNFVEGSDLVCEIGVIGLDPHRLRCPSRRPRSVEVLPLVRWRAPLVCGAARRMPRAAGRAVPLSGILACGMSGGTVPGRSRGVVAIPLSPKLRVVPVSVLGSFRRTVMRRSGARRVKALLAAEPVPGGFRIGARGGPQVIPVSPVIGAQVATVILVLLEELSVCAWRHFARGRERWQVKEKGDKKGQKRLKPNKIQLKLLARFALVFRGSKKEF